ncbi:MAG: hypothetical protein ACK5RG_15425 [Cyclobacteriaceae bacterium]|jgi:hypothetical protein
MRLFRYFLFGFMLSNCKMYPISSTNELQFIVFPKVVYLENQYFVQFQLSKKDKQGRRVFLMSVSSRIVDEKLCYFFSGATSNFYEIGNLQKINIDEKHLPYVRTENVYWLNSDGSKVKLSVQ